MQSSLFDTQCELIELPQAELRWYANFYSSSEAERFFKQLMDTLEFHEERIRIAGVERLVPRLTAWYGDKDARYSYSGVRHNPLPWTQSLLSIKHAVEQQTQVQFNSVLANLYRDGNDSVAWHADDEPELGARPTIASLSLGQSRCFELKHTTTKQKYRIELEAGSLLVMSGETQQYWHHQVPKEKNIHQPRINLTFRSIIR